MTAPARLLALRLQGFKSFAERTVVEFGPGISAVVGPNGSGKSNLADALRWSLGEQGRALRSRKAEDVIFAGSEKRAALGMADVTLVLDNADGLLPVDFSVLELGRRLYRSGENDYLLNRQRVRLRDLVDLLDAAHLADNAFLFIGQGMVDQALALRPEERRPLFEEVAGVRRHERRRRKAEEQLVESEANLARVEDILAELRPQARRLAAQAEQQASRSSAGEELAAAIVAAAHARWFDAAGRVAEAEARRARARGGADQAMAELQRAEEVAGAIAGELAARSAQEAGTRSAHGAALARLQELRLREARLAGDLDGAARDRRRLADDRAAAEADLSSQRRILAEPVPERDPGLEAAAEEGERALAEALAELGALRAASQARGESLAAARRAEAARQAERETIRRRLSDAERRADEERARSASAAERREALTARVAEAGEVLRAVVASEVAATAQREQARAAVESAEAGRTAAAARSSAGAASVAGLRARLEALETRLAEEEARGIARAARRRGGRRLDEDLVVDPALRAAVETALSEAARAYLVPIEAVSELAAERGMLVVEPARGTPGRAAGQASAAERRFRDRVAELGGGMLGEAVRRDGTGAARRLLDRAAWLPDLATALLVQPDLPPGWVAVPRDGAALVGDLAVVLGRADTPLERRAEAQRLAGELERLVGEAAMAEDAHVAATTAVEGARAALEAARAAESEALGERRRAEEAERLAARELEALVRESAWHDAQAARLAGEVARLRDALATSDAAERDRAEARSGPGTSDEAAAAQAWESRVAELRSARDRVAADLAAVESRRREAEARRARAEAALAIDEDRIGRTDREREAIDAREASSRRDLEAVRIELERAVHAEAAARSALEALHAADAADRGRLAAIEQAAATARERLRAADERLRAAEHADLEARLALDALREQLLVELAGLGDLGLRVLSGSPDVDADAGPANGDDAADAAHAADAADTADGSLATSAFEAALERRAIDWAATRPATEAPGPSRLASLRRRYHELGAANPFAVEEYEALRVRLEALEAQQADLRGAIARTRDLIGELNGMIAEQFRATFRALEVAFDARFRQLFDGGFARLTLTDPGDLAATGVEIVARPPGKKAQALSMLSGGERALTAVALLFAMLEVRPVPFCVLDEVDAALDEANVGRFSDALRGLAAQTQFIVITHNRGTIEAADALYGVTVGDDSVSRVISLRLDEARAIADRGRSAELLDPVG